MTQDWGGDRPQDGQLDQVQVRSAEARKRAMRVVALECASRVTTSGASDLRHLTDGESAGQAMRVLEFADRFLTWLEQE